jgi:hypothetical protein
MAVEALELGEEAGFGEIAVDDADGIAGVHRRDQAVPGRLDGIHMPGCDIAGGADQGEVLHAMRSCATRVLVHAKM